MLGMDMMLKSFGLDPELIKKNVGEFGKIVVDIQHRLARIENLLLTQSRVEEPKEIKNDSRGINGGSSNVDGAGGGS